MLSSNQSESLKREGRITLAIQSIQQGQIQSTRSAAKPYDIPRKTLRDRLKGKRVRRDCTPNCLKLTKLEEQVIVNFILDLDSQGFSPRVYEVEDIANLLLTKRDGILVRKNWSTRFITRRPEIKSRFNHKYDYKRA
jgi:hypothetical protein